MKRALALALGLAVGASACSGSDGGVTSTSFSPGTTAVASTSAAPGTTTSSAPTTTVGVVETTSTTTSAPTTSTTGVFLSVETMWESELQVITLYEDGTLVAGSAQGQAEIPAAHQYRIETQAAIQVVELGSPEYSEAILVSLPSIENEDPPNVEQLFVPDGKVLRRVLNRSFGVYGVTSLDFLGDGTLEYLESGWTACGRSGESIGSGAEVPLQIVTLGFVGDDMSEIERRDSTVTQKCDELAACPYVYVMGAEGEELIGEILRNIRGRDAYTTQSLELPTQHGLLHVQLREEKEEVTYLDAIALLVDGEKILPLACGDGGDLSHCGIDGISLRLEEGDVLDLWFEVPSTATSLELSATGYYVPTPQP